MRRLAVMLGVMAAVAAVCTSCQSLRLPRPGTHGPKILCHYQAWYQWRIRNGSPKQAHWGWPGPGPHHRPDDVTADGLRDIASTLYPRIGLYDSADPDVIDYQILTAKAAGIEGFVVDWEGPNNATDDAIQVLMTRADALGFRVALRMREKLCFPPVAAVTTRAEAVAEAERLVHEAVVTYTGLPAYLHYNRRPVLFVADSSGQWGDRGDKSFSGPEWAAIVNRAGAKDLYITPQRFLTDNRFIRAAYGWCGGPGHVEWVRKTGDRRLSEGNLDFYVAPANPGYDDRGTWGKGKGPTIGPSLGTETYDNYWRQAAASQAAAVQVISWNAYGEGMAVEPTIEWGHLLIDETERHVHDLTGRPIDLADNDLPYSWLLARQRLGNRSEVSAIHDALAAGKPREAASLLKALVVSTRLPLPLYVDASQEARRYEVWSDEGRRREALLREVRKANLMAHAIAAASSVNDAVHPPESAVDGDLSTRWVSSAEDNQWLRVTWPDPVEARELVIMWEADYARDYLVRLSADGEHWISLAHVTDGRGGVVRMPMNAGPFRFLQLELRRRISPRGFSIYEIGLLK